MKRYLEEIADLLLTVLPAALKELSSHGYIDEAQLESGVARVGVEARRLAAQSVSPKDRAPDTEVVQLIDRLAQISKRIRDFHDAVFSGGGTGLTKDLNNLHADIETAQRNLGLMLAVKA